MESKTNQAIRIAYLKGYRVNENGDVISAHGKTRAVTIPQRKFRPPYKRFNVGTGGSNRFPVKVCELVAFQKFGEAALAPNIVTRHLDGNPLNDHPDNIEL